MSARREVKFPYPRHWIVHVVTIAVCVYALLSGALFEGITDAPTRTLSMLLLTVLCGAWWIERLIRGRPYNISLVDGIAAAWVGAIAVAWIANGLTNRRSEIGAWYDSLALLTVLIVVDLIRRGLPRRWLIDGILLAGGYVILAACQQVWFWFSTWFSLRSVGMPFRPDRPSAVLGNANTLATVLIVLILLALPRVWQRNHAIVRIGWGLYALLAGGVLLLTESKGAWIGLIAGGIALGLSAWRASEARISFRQAARIGGVGAMVGGAVFVFAGLPLLVADARSDGRLGIYAVALHAILERPLFGYGPDSFGQQLMIAQSIPPQPPHSHAHDVPLHVGAELGLGGLLALALTAIGWVYLYWRQLTRAPNADSPGHARTASCTELIGLGAACLAVAGHGLFDVTASLPAVFLLDAVIFGAAIAASPLQSSTAGRHVGRPLQRSGAVAKLADGSARRGLKPAGYQRDPLKGVRPSPDPPPSGGDGVSQMALVPVGLASGARRLPSPLPAVGPGVRLALTLFVIAGGWWGTLVYWPYFNGVSAAVPGEYQKAAALLDAAAAVDPTSPVTWAAAGYVHALAALVDKQADDLPLAIHAYEQAVALEPAYSINWLNLAALYAKAGQGADAVRAVTQVAHDAPDDPYLAINRGLILEQFGYGDEAQALYDTVLTQFPALSRDSVWQQTALRREVAARHPTPPTPTENVLALVAAGQIQAAAMQVAADKAANSAASEPYVDAALLKIRTTKDIEADSPMIRQNLGVAATLREPDPGSLAWVDEALAELALARGNQVGYEREMAQAAVGYNRGPDGFTLDLGGSVPVAAYFMTPLPRTLLPIVWYPNVPGDLQRVLAEDSSF